MSRKTLYDILGVSERADRAAIDAAFRERIAAAERDEAMRVALREAHAVLSDLERRSAYDARLRQDALTQAELALVIERASTQVQARNYTKVWLAIALVFVGLVAFNTWRGTRLQSEIMAAQERAIERAQEQAEGSPEERAAAAELAAARSLEREERRVAQERERIERENERAFERARREQDSAEWGRAEMARREQERKQREQQRREYEAQAREQSSEYENRRLREEQLRREKAYLEQLEADNRRLRL